MFSSKQMLLPLISIITYLFCFYQTSLADDSKGKKASIEQCCVQVKNGACKNATLLAINRKIPKSCAILEPFCAKTDGRPDSEYDSIYDKLTAIAGEGYPGNGNELEPFDPSNPNVLLPSAKCVPRGKACFGIFFIPITKCCGRCLFVFQNPITGVCR